MSRQHNPMTRDHGGKLPEMLPKHRTCQWIDGHGKAKAFTCRAETVNGSSYCAEHHARVYTRYVPDWLKVLRRIA